MSKEIQEVSSFPGIDEFQSSGNFPQPLRATQLVELSKIYEDQAIKQKAVIDELKKDNDRKTGILDYQDEQLKKYSKTVQSQQEDISALQKAIVSIKQYNQIQQADFQDIQKRL